jgi:hypothetical protein
VLRSYRHSWLMWPCISEKGPGFDSISLYFSLIHLGVSLKLCHSGHWNGKQEKQNPRECWKQSILH